MMATYEEYRARFSDEFEAGDYENNTLQTWGRANLPAFAQVVFDGGDASDEYWDWLLKGLAVDEREAAVAAERYARQEARRPFQADE
jgi:hypothetical protein